MRVEIEAGWDGTTRAPSDGMYFKLSWGKTGRDRVYFPGDWGRQSARLCLDRMEQYGHKRRLVRFAVK